ncbi:GNAT family N-acetyltransferase [Rossellomorea aquimaris]|uniref:GNAT family N-acetyltransferase n=1 Tax=Rossellomorea aquimaris TaxID=189382 RepID=UPI001CD4DF00|nr:GNAT family protein [Rossellomorea aquimaris]MCA1053732.1 GNAT family N-acetyltransferase [Rossellomorea aquimaris]
MDIPEQSLGTERLKLREMVQSDWKDIHAYASREEVCQYQPWGPNTIEDTQTFLKEVLNDANNCPRTRYTLAIECKEEKRLIGAIELTMMNQHRSGEIGYIVHPDYWGKGIATEAAKQMMIVAFQYFKLHRIQATCDPNNHASEQVLKKIGMKKEGIMRENMLIKNGWRDSAIYSILEDEVGKL